MEITSFTRYEEPKIYVETYSDFVKITVSDKEEEIIIFFLDKTSSVKLATEILQECQKL